LAIRPNIREEREADGRGKKGRIESTDTTGNLMEGEQGEHREDGGRKQIEKRMRPIKLNETYLGGKEKEKARG